MRAKGLEANVRWEPGVAVVDLRGDVNGFGEETLNAAYAEAEGRDPKVVLLNFGGVDYINSTGIALIVGLLARARASKRRLLAYGLSDHYVEIFAITRLSEHITLCKSEEEAIRVANAP